ncbi:ABC transporter ATP-binding protein [Megamonas funiformis]|uniref:ABC transporter ATP-binding protein n=1 Tax=Megamonas funiformis TaxID=437897 RepID=UPI001431E2D9|nr:ABC transporter ATP-binding protein [Megamonas funiformis]NJE28353.1 ABC transporter ATP-binding protein [Megamonas funiformis]
MKETYLKITNLNKKFFSKIGEVNVLDNLSLEVNKGEFIVIVGKSGCGKSTLLRLIAGLDKANSGDIFLNNEVITKPNLMCSMIFQEHRLFPWLTVKENIEFVVGDSLKEQVDWRIKFLLKLVGLSKYENVYVSELSGGMAQRIALVRALINRPKLLLMDEPFSALDALNRIKMQNIFVRILNNREYTKIMVTHDIEEAVFLADRVLLMENGSIKKELDIKIKYPRNRMDENFISKCREIYNWFF